MPCIHDDISIRDIFFDLDERLPRSADMQKLARLLSDPSKTFYIVPDDLPRMPKTIKAALFLDFRIATIPFVKTGNLDFMGDALNAPDLVEAGCIRGDNVRKAHLPKLARAKDIDLGVSELAADELQDARYLHLPNAVKISFAKLAKAEEIVCPAPFTARRPITLPSAANEMKFGT